MGEGDRWTAPGWARGHFGEFGCNSGRHAGVGLEKKADVTSADASLCHGWPTAPDESLRGDAGPLPNLSGTDSSDLVGLG